MTKTSIAIGETHLSRDKKIFHITRELKPTENGFSLGLRFQGEQIIDEDKAWTSRALVRFDNEGRHRTRLDTASTPSDLVRRIFLADDLKKGDVVLFMHHGKPDSGLLKDWKINGNPFEIDAVQFDGMIPKDKVFGEGEAAIESDEAILISKSIDTDGFISGVLIMYRSNEKFFIAHLLDPYWDKQLSQSC